MKSMKVKVTFTEPLLGTVAMDEEVMTNFIASKAPDAPSMEEEIAALGEDAFMEKGMTGFARTDDGEPMNWDYAHMGIRGFLGLAYERAQRLEEMLRPKG